MQLHFNNDQWSLLVRVVTDVQGVKNNYVGEVEDDTAQTKAVWDENGVDVTLPD